MKVLLWILCLLIGIAAFAGGIWQITISDPTAFGGIITGSIMMAIGAIGLLSNKRPR